ncbi:MAG: hypothetical protein ABI670_17160 [Chloroflexota bacterium]
MKKVVLFAVAAFALLGLSVTGAYAQTTGQNTLTVTMNQQNGSGQDGTATITQQGSDIMVMVNLANGSSTSQPAHIHRGTCANLDPVPAVPLSNVVNGTSSTTISGNATITSLADLTAGQYAINVHKSAAEVTVYTSCGDIVAQQLGTGTGTTTTPGMPSTGNSDFTLAAALILLGLGMTGTGLKLARRKA